MSKELAEAIEENVIYEDNQACILWVTEGSSGISKSTCVIIFYERQLKTVRLGGNVFFEYDDRDSDRTVRTAEVQKIRKLMLVASLCLEMF